MHLCARDSGRWWVMVGPKWGLEEEAQRPRAAAQRVGEGAGKGWRGGAE